MADSPFVREAGETRESLALQSSVKLTSLHFFYYLYEMNIRMSTYNINLTDD